ncbi:MAG: thioesterase family protein [Phenylobacterium sp.]|uniref:thioesterase family protein n=1 Tax=Phenylobacterium sp. TaxID=1871053 RepID=UPI0027301896|nr:thioesterase family protein [Phenylobacterium sp.]MDP2011825.1 thioesterase family protein [Phenylobacterium sp.]
MTQSDSISLTPVSTGRWTTFAGPEWQNPGGGLWGGYAIGLFIRVLEAEPEAVGEALSLTLTYAAALPSGQVDIRTRRLRQGGSIGVWEVELLGAGSDQVAVHGMVTMARRPETPPFAFAVMPEAPTPESLPSPDHPGTPLHYGALAFERRGQDIFPPQVSGDSRSLVWVRSRRGPWDKALLGMVTDNSAPRAMYALGRTINNTTLSLTVYLHATVEELAKVGDDFILIECEGRVGGGGASDERSSYWSRDGKLLATSEQLTWYRPVQRRSPE